MRSIKLFRPENPLRLSRLFMGYGIVFMSVFCAGIFAVTPSMAQQNRFEYSSVSRIYKDKNVAKIAGMDAKSVAAANEAWLELHWKIEATLGQLLGEPVVSIRFHYEILNGDVTVPIMTSRGTAYRLVNYHKLPKELQDKVRLYDVHVRMQFITPEKNARSYRLDIIEDVGATEAAGTWSFNVPGSPDWDELFLRSGASDTFHSVEVAKEAWQTKLRLNGAFIEQGDLNFHLLHAHYNDMYHDRELYRALEDGYAQLAKGLNRSYGINVNDFARSKAWTSDWFRGERSDGLDLPSDWRKRTKDMIAHMDKLSKLPDHLRVGGNHGPYDAAVSNYNKLNESARYSLFNFKPSGPDPNTQPKGHEPQFDAAMSMPKFVMRYGPYGYDIYEILADGSIGEMVRKIGYADFVNQAILNFRNLYMNCEEDNPIQSYVTFLDGRQLDTTNVKMRCNTYLEHYFPGSLKYLKYENGTLTETSYEEAMQGYFVMIADRVRLYDDLTRDACIFDSDWNLISCERGD